MYNNIFDETIFINKNYHYETLFNYKSKIILYDDYIELNNEIKKYDIIIDHQLYWFELDITKKTFLNIPFNKIIRIIHGVPIHHIDINEYNFYYTIELYNDINSHNSWNNHIKIYNNIGITKYNKNILFDENNINIAIVGRINEDKVPNIFLKILVKFLLHNKKYKFNFYGEIDETYKKNFINNINNNTNIIYHGIIDPNNIKNIYLNNDILLHPSKMEAGATVVLEAMSFGLPIICRNTSGLENAIGNKNYNYLCKDENEMFKKLMLINNLNYKDISKNNVLKILNENSEKILFTKLVNEIKLIYDYEQIIDEIPNIIHYIYGLKKQTQEFSFIYYLSILSNYIINKPLTIYFHYQYLPYGYWWEKAKKYLKLNYINTNNIYWGNKKITKFAHKSDKIRLEMLLKYGGIYMDIDTITYKPYEDLLKYDFVIGIQEENYGENNNTLYCNAILFSKKNNIFIKKWIEEYENYFLPNGWCEASVHLPELILNKLEYNDKKNIKILDKECFYSPLYNEVEKIFENNGIINDNLLTLHLWNTYSEKYYKNILNFDWCYTNESLYSLLIKNILNIYSNNKLNINIKDFDSKDEDQDQDSLLFTEIYNENVEDSLLFSEINNSNYNIKKKEYKIQDKNKIIFNKIYSISIITIFNQKLNYKNLLYSIANIEQFYKLNIELIIIDNIDIEKNLNSSESSSLFSETNVKENRMLFNDIYNNDIKLKKIFIEKNFSIKIINLNVDNNIYDIYDIFNIGIINSKHKLISFFNIDDIIIDDEIFLKCYNYENIISSSYNILNENKHILNNNYTNIDNTYLHNYYNLNNDYIEFINEIYNY